MKPQVLILEDDFLLSEDLANLVRDALDAIPVVATTVSDATDLIDDNIVFAFLDIDLPDGTSYSVAKKLLESGIPLVFVTGKEREIVPKEFKNIPFVAKPASVDNLVQLAKSLSSAFE
jgi:DNA-binding LytR/AlgR family response regulator